MYDNAATGVIATRRFRADMKMLVNITLSMEDAGIKSTHKHYCAVCHSICAVSTLPGLGGTRMG